MNKKKIGIVIIVIVITVLIIRINNKKQDKVIIKDNKKIVKVDKRKEVVKDVKIFIDIIPVRIVRVKPVLYKWVPKSKVRFHYSWFVNGEEAGDDELMLGSEYLHKGDKVYCTILPYRNGKEFEKLKSKEVIIPNSSPVIKYTNKPYIDDNGRFNYTVNAIDIDDDDLTYSLIDPLDGITIDNTNGDISVDLDIIKKNFIKRKSESIIVPEGEKAGNNNEYNKDDLVTNSIVKIKFKVTDSDGAQSIGSIMFDFMKGEEVGA